ncbi:hypothetical protein AB205_0015360, partial [Aquarana catesbeiana]
VTTRGTGTSISATPDCLPLTLYQAAVYRNSDTVLLGGGGVYRLDEHELPECTDIQLRVLDDTPLGSIQFVFFFKIVPTPAELHSSGVIRGDQCG